LEMLVSGIKAEIRASDFIGRYGGDEFLLVLDECEGNSALQLLDRLRTRFQSKPMTVGDSQVKISFAAGIVSVNPGDPLVMKELLRNCERALENSKEAGRNRTAMAPPPPPPEAPASKGPISGQETQIVG
jgi:diguanylate cyclase (GGDEF)-like protein